MEQVLAQLRHAYQLLSQGQVVNQKAFADGLIAPNIRKLEELQQKQVIVKGGKETAW